MKTLIVSTDGKLMVTRPLWEAAREVFDFDHVEVTREHGLEAYFNETDFSGYDRVIADTNLRRLGKRYQCLKRAPGLVVFDHDVCQNNVSSSEWYKRYPSVLRDIGEVRIIVSGSQLASQLQREGIDACYLPKGYDNKVNRGCRFRGQGEEQGIQETQTVPAAPRETGAGGVVACGPW